VKETAKPFAEKWKAEQPPNRLDRERRLVQALQYVVAEDLVERTAEEPVVGALDEHGRCVNDAHRDTADVLARAIMQVNGQVGPRPKTVAEEQADAAR
jgi:hypothetical protein